METDPPSPRVPPELCWGRWDLLDTGDAAVLAHHADWDYSTVVEVHNLAARRGTRRGHGLSGQVELVDLFEDEQHPLERGAATLQLGPFEGRWYCLRRPGPRLPS